MVWTEHHQVSPVLPFAWAKNGASLGAQGYSCIPATFSTWGKGESSGGSDLCVVSSDPILFSAIWPWNLVNRNNGNILGWLGNDEATGKSLPLLSHGYALLVTIVASQDSLTQLELWISCCGVHRWDKMLSPLRLRCRLFCLELPIASS